MNKDEIKKGLACCTMLEGFKGCSKCPYFSTHRCNSTLCEDALNLINKQEQEIGRLKTELTKLKSKANDYKQRYESSEKRYLELTQSGCEALRAKEEHFQEKGKKVENNMKSVLEDEKKQAVKEFAEKLKKKFYYVFGNEYEQSVSGFDTKVLIEHIHETLKEYEK